VVCDHEAAKPGDKAMRNTVGKDEAVGERDATTMDGMPWTLREAMTTAQPHAYGLEVARSARPCLGMAPLVSVT
jgi:hypothetical protein